MIRSREKMVTLNYNDDNKIHFWLENAYFQSLIKTKLFRILTSGLLHIAVQTLLNPKNAKL